MSLLLDALHRSKGRSRQRGAEQAPSPEFPSLPAEPAIESLALTLDPKGDSVTAEASEITPSALHDGAADPAVQAWAPPALEAAQPMTRGEAVFVEPAAAQGEVQGHRFPWSLVLCLGLLILASMAWQYWQVTHTPARTPVDHVRQAPAAQPIEAEAERSAAPASMPGGVTVGGASKQPDAMAPRVVRTPVAPPSSPPVNGAAAPVSAVQAAAAIEPTTPRPAVQSTDSANRPAQLVRSQVQLQLQQAWSALRQGDAARAQALYQQVLVSRPGDPDAMLGLAVSLHRQQQLEAAWLAYQRSLQVWPDNETARAGMLGILSESDPDTAQSRLQEMVQERPRDVAALASLGSLLGRQGRWAQALGPLTMAQALAPDSVAHASNLAVAFDQLGRHVEALQMYRHALQLGAAGVSAQALERRIAELQGRLVP